ncbi:MAG TPA: SH3 domain-containing protein [Bacteroidales bacterium]|nr:SH3 domain-containing protein [Bacteroidales bacterium]HRZ48928.1 SH3 domain-containing protein [Bacteroidales bacterium]
MRNFCLVLITIFLLSACRHKNENLQNKADSLKGADSALVNRKLGYMDCNAMIVGEGVRLRATPDTRGEVIEKLNTGVLLKIIRNGEKKVLMGDPDPCNTDGFYWYEVMEPGGKRGWIYGAFMYPLVIPGRNDENLQEPLRKLMAAQFPFKNGTYRIGLARSGYRSYVSPAGDSLCVDYILPFFWLPDQGTGFPLRYVKSAKKNIRMLDLTKEQNYFRLTEGGVFDDKLTGFSARQNTLRLNMNRELQVDGTDPFTYTLEIKPGQGVFTITPVQ